MKIVVSVGLAWDSAILQYLLDGDHEVNRESSEFFGGVSIKLDRPRPPEEEEEEEEGEREEPRACGRRRP